MSGCLLGQNYRALNGRTLLKDLQLPLWNGKLGQAAMQADQDLGKNQHMGFIQTAWSGKMDSNFGIEHSLLFGIASSADHGCLLYLRPVLRGCLSSLSVDLGTLRWKNPQSKQIAGLAIRYRGVSFRADLSFGEVRTSSALSRTWFFDAHDLHGMGYPLSNTRVPRNGPTEWRLSMTYATARAKVCHLIREIHDD
jgi:hypothetical protein